MGNLQSLMIILAIVIVGVSIAVGIQFYAQENVKAARQVCFSELNEFTLMAKTWWNTPLEQGGGGKPTTISGSGGPALNNLDKLGIYIGYNYQTSNNTFSTLNASYQIQNGGPNSVKFNCTANVNSNGSPINIILNYNMKTDDIQINIVN